jgi:predicted AAA+ superfamily ATPase
MEDTYTESLRGILDDSCEWLFKRQEYLRWTQHLDAGNPSSLLWIVGIPGAGKTKLATRAIANLRQSHVVSYFYCNTEQKRLALSASYVPGHGSLFKALKLYQKKWKISTNMAKNRAS